MAGLGWSPNKRRGGNQHTGGVLFVKSTDDKKPYKFGSQAKFEFDYNANKDSPSQGFVHSNKRDNSSFTTMRDPNSQFNGGKVKGSFSQQQTFTPVPPAKLFLTPEQYWKLWQNEKDPTLAKIRKLAWEVASLKSERPNAIDKLHSASNRVPTTVEFIPEIVIASRGSNSFRCHVFVEGIHTGSGEGPKIKNAKTNGYEIALQKILLPELRINKRDPETRELEGSKVPITWPPPKPSDTVLKSCARATQSFKGDGTPAPLHKESNFEAAGVKRRIGDQRPLEDFVIVEPLIPIADCTPAHTLRRSADFNHMLLEYEYIFCGDAVRCIMSVEGQVLADVQGGSKLGAKNRAAEQGLKRLKEICWVIKTKQAVDSDTKISKDEMLNELSDQSDMISDDNVGNKLLRKMGWSGGGVGKDGSGIAEPVALKSVVNREGLGLGTHMGITDEYKRRVKEVIENYASSGNQEDLVFNCDFRLEERLIIHDECRRLNLRSKCKGKGSKRYICVRRKRSANMLFHHIMSCGGETIRYKLVPPGDDTVETYLPPRSLYSFSLPSNVESSGQLSVEQKPFVKAEAFTINHFENVGLNRLTGSVLGSINQDRDTREAECEFMPPRSVKAEAFARNHCENAGHNRFTENDSDLIKKERVRQDVKCEIGPLPSLMDLPVRNNFDSEFLEQSTFSEYNQPSSRQNRFQFENSLSKTPQGDKINPFNNPLPVVKREIKEEFDPEIHGRFRQELQNSLYMDGNFKKENCNKVSPDRRNYKCVKKEAEHEPFNFSGNNTQRRVYDNNQNPNMPQNYNYLNRHPQPDFDKRNVTALFNDSTMRPGNTCMQNGFTRQGSSSDKLYNNSPMSQNTQQYARPISRTSNSEFMTFTAQNQWFGEQEQNQQFSHLWNHMTAQRKAGLQGRNMSMGGGPRFNLNRQGSRGNSQW